MATAPIPMDIIAVSQAAAKDVAAVEFGGGAIWELDCCQVEVYRGGDADGEQASRADGWKVAASRKTKRWERKKDKDRPQPPRAHERDVLSQIEQRSTQIENELHDILEKEGNMRVVDSQENSIRVRSTSGSLAW